MQQKRACASAILVSLTLAMMLVSLQTDPVKANPVVIGLIRSEYGTITNGTLVSMPFANVRADIVRAQNEINVQMEGNYTITTNLSQNATLGFAFPKNQSLIEDFTMQIYMNSTLVSHQIFGWDDFEMQAVFSNCTVDDYLTVYWASFAIFNFELIGNATYIMNVNSTMTTGIAFYEGYETLGNEYWYEYIVASANTFNGSTIETVTFSIYDEPDFDSKSYIPDEYLTVSDYDDYSEAIWHFNTSEFTDERVRFKGCINAPFYQQPGFNTIVVFGLVVIGLISVAIIYRKFIS
ncbi:MAG: hypothetical protein JW779_05970 [Candidatus Thorarchaeota archaeon]|nr:hypothetical protein [Candidatus Thorarchaeota archaeon]